MIGGAYQPTHGAITEMGTQALGQFVPVQSLRAPGFEQVLVLRAPTGLIEQ